MKGDGLWNSKTKFYSRKGLWRTNSLKISKHLKLLEANIAMNVGEKEISVYYTLP